MGRALAMIGSDHLSDDDRKALEGFAFAARLSGIDVHLVTPAEKNEAMNKVAKKARMYLETQPPAGQGFAVADLVRELADEIDRLQAGADMWRALRNPPMTRIIVPDDAPPVSMSVGCGSGGEKTGHGGPMILTPWNPSDHPDVKRAESLGVMFSCGGLATPDGSAPTYHRWHHPDAKSSKPEQFATLLEAARAALAVLDKEGKP